VFPSFPIRYSSVKQNSRRPSSRDFENGGARQASSKRSLTDTDGQKRLGRGPLKAETGVSCKSELLADGLVGRQQKYRTTGSLAKPRKEGHPIALINRALVRPRLRALALLRFRKPSLHPRMPNQLAGAAMQV
jgi:hypothetical protein